MGVGGHIDTAGLISRLEATFTAEIDAAVPLPPAVPASAAVPAISAVSTPAVPAPAPAVSGSGTRTGSSAATAGSTTCTSSPAGPSDSHSAPTSSPTSSPSVFQRSRSGAPSRSGCQSRASGPSEAAPAPSSSSSPFRRNRRPSTLQLRRAPERTRPSSVPSLRTTTIKRASTVQASPVAWPWVSFAVAFPHASASTIWFAFAPAFGFLGVDAFGGVSAFRALDAAGTLFAEGQHGSERGVRSRPRQFGRLQWRRLVYFFVVSRLVLEHCLQRLSGEFSSGAFLPPAGTPSGWRQPRYAPWPKRVRRLRLHLITVQELRTLFLPPPGWIIPRHAPPEPSNWNRALVTPANVEALYATQPWRYLAQAAEAYLFASGDAAFRPFSRRLQRHLEHWAQAYWESTHEL
ncbi:hypothetical protein PR003_g32324, partial [Phytophthora rubi]